MEESAGEENSADRLSRPGTKEEDNIQQPHLCDLTVVRPTSSYSLTHLTYLSRVSAVKMSQTMQTDREISRPGPCFTFLSVMLPVLCCTLSSAGLICRCDTSFLLQLTFT